MQNCSCIEHLYTFSSARWHGVVASMTGKVLLCCVAVLVFLSFNESHQRNDYTFEAVSDGSTAVIKSLKNDFSFL